MKQTLFSLLVFVALQTNAQRFMTKTGAIDFGATGAIEKIEGSNKSVACLLDSKSGSLDFIIQIKSFVFEKQLMQEHFNENYMESTKFPKAKFKGTIEGFKKEMLTAPVANIKITGVLNVHGVDKTIMVPGTIGLLDGKLVATSKYKVTPEDFGIAIPSLVRDKVGKEMEITVKSTYLPYGQ